MDEILVSVIIPTYGRPLSLERAIDSVTSQEFRSFEVIIVDDNNPGSPERMSTEELMEKYKNDGHIRYIKHEKNKNGAAARNTGILNSRGKYTAFLDDDDLFLENHIREEYDFLENHPEYGGVYCWRIQNNVLCRPKYTGDLSVQLLMGNYCVPTSSLMIRKNILLELNGFDESYRRHQDLEIMLRFFEKYSVGVICKPLVKICSSDGKNALHGQDLINLKDTFLSRFSNVIERLEREKHGTKKKIICANYSRVWADHLHRGPLKKCFEIFIKYFKKYPLCFTRSCLELIIIFIRTRITNKFKKSA